MGLDDLEKSILREKFMYGIVCTDRVSANLSGVIIHSKAQRTYISLNCDLFR